MIPISCQSASPAIFPAQMQCDTRGLLWQTPAICRDRAVLAIEETPSGHLFVQTSTSIIALSSANGTVLWESPIQNAAKMAQLSNGNIVCLTDNASRLSLLDGSTGTCLQTINSVSFATNAPVISPCGHICTLQKNKLSITVYDEALRHVREFTLGKQVVDSIVMLENTLVATSSQALECIDLQRGLSSSIPLPTSPHTSSKASSRTLFIEYKDGKNYLFDVQTHQLIPLAISIQPQTHPLAVEDGTYGIVCQSMTHQGFEDIYTIRLVKPSGELQWQVSDCVEPRFMLANANKQIIVAFSPSHETVRLANPFQPPPSCYIKIYDLQGTKLYTHISPQPILSPLACNTQGCIYFYSDGKVHALNLN